MTTYRTHCVKERLILVLLLISLVELRAAKLDLEKAGVTIDCMSDHTVFQSLYLRDPDGNEIELYVDADEAIWKNNPAAAVAPIKPLHL